MKYKDIPQVTESERAAVEAALLAKFGRERPLADGKEGNSPYDPQTVVFGPDAALKRGCRVSIAPVCQSHNGAGQYKGRGRWRTVFIVAPAAEGDYAVCRATDRDAEGIGDSGFHVRPWATHAAEQASGGLGKGAGAMAAALDSVGLGS